MCKILSLTHSKKIFHSFLSLLPQLFLFELAFKALSLFLFIPGGKKLIVMMLEISGDTSLYTTIWFRSFSVFRESQPLS